MSASTAEVPIPAGYRAMAADVMYDVASYDGGGTDFHLSIGGQNPQLIGADVWRTVLPGEEQALAIATFGLYQPGFSMAIEIWCARTARAYEEWQNKTYSAIMQSYLRLLSEYEDKLAELAAQEGPITGRDSLLNRVLEQTELKKACIALFTGQQFDSFESMALSPEDLPEMNLAQVGVEGPYVRFFEQALEWDQVMYFFYPYYWNEKPNWRFRILLNDTDPLFAEFLRAGWARVVIPVRPGFAEAVGHFLDTGEVWNGGDLPNVTSPFYLSIIQELKESEGAPGLEVPQGDPWDVRLPTSLVLLKKDDTLPSWHKDPQGNWVPD